MLTPQSVSQMLACPTCLRVYHLLSLALNRGPVADGDLPINMDTGDALGDLFFSIYTAYQPIECATDGRAEEGSMTAKLDCINAEQTSPDLVITQLTLVSPWHSLGAAERSAGQLTGAKLGCV
jgi:hypothetical protein